MCMKVYIVEMKAKLLQQLGQFAVLLANLCLLQACLTGLLQNVTMQPDIVLCRRLVQSDTDRGGKLLLQVRNQLGHGLK